VSDGREPSVAGEEQAAGGARVRQRLTEAATMGGAAFVGLFFLLPLHAIVSLEESASLLAVLAGVLVTVTLLRPMTGLTVLILLLPLSALVERLTRGAPLAGDVVDLLVLAFAAGASFRLVRKAVPGERLLGPAALLAVVVVTSTIVELRILQSITPGEPLLPQLWHYVTRDYWTELRAFPVVRVTYRWLAWLALAVYAERTLAVNGAPTTHVALRFWMGAGVAGALVVLHQMLVMVLARPEPFWTAMADLWRHTRLSVLQPDVNAAGSYWLLFLVPALVLPVLTRRLWWLAVLSAPVLLAALGLARSRAAIAAGVLVLCAAGITHFWRRQRRDRPVARRLTSITGVAVLGMLVLAGTYYATAATHAGLTDATQIRIDLAKAGIEAVRRHPVFGVGLSDYVRVTRRFITPDMTLLHASAPEGENSHNNLLQIAVELGLPACLVFLWFVWRAVGPALVIGASPVALAMALGIMAFLTSALSGHPLLVPLVGAVFFVAVGLTAGAIGPGDRPVSWAEPVYWIAAGMYLGSLFWRG
jgi:hypothetical protein